MEVAESIIRFESMACSNHSLAFTHNRVYIRNALDAFDMVVANSRDELLCAEKNFSLARIETVKTVDDALCHFQTQSNLLLRTKQ